MMRKRTLLFSVLLLGLLLWPATAFAASGHQDEPDQEVIYGDLALTSDYDIEANTVVNGDVVIFGGEIDLEGTVNGDVTLFGGDLDLHGTITGELVVVGGNLSLGEGVSLAGSCLVLGGDIDDNGIELGCTTVLPGTIGLGILDGLGVPLPEINPPVPFGSPGDIPGDEWAGPPAPELVWGPEAHERSFFARLAQGIGTTLLAGFLAFVAAAVFPVRLAEVSDAVARKPAAAGTIGFLTAVAAISLLTLTSILWVPLLLVLTLLCGLGILLGLAGVAFMGGTAIFGWTAVGALVGERLAGRLGFKQPSYATLAALGTGAMTLGIGLLGLLPFTPDVLLGIAIFSIGLGGVVLTRFGRQPYPLIRTPEIDRIKVDEAIANMPDDFV